MRQNSPLVAVLKFAKAKPTMPPYSQFAMSFIFSFINTTHEDRETGHFDAALFPKRLLRFAAQGIVIKCSLGLCTRQANVFMTVGFV